MLVLVSLVVVVLVVVLVLIFVLSEGMQGHITYWTSDFSLRGCGARGVVLPCETLRHD